MERIEQSAAYRYRGDCETDIEFKQIIPYCLITRGQETFVYRRKNGSDEKRLHAKFSVGIGGHINPKKSLFSTRSVIQASMFREITEEVEISADIEHDHSPKFIGMINWDEDEVGTVHFGLVYHIQLPEHTTVEIREKDKLEGSFQPVNEVCEIDNWEKLVKLSRRRLPYPLFEKELTMLRVVVVNGVAAHGKDSFVKFAIKHFDGVAINHSTVATVKEAAKFFGADQDVKKGDAERRLWSDVKDAWTRYNDGPFREIVATVKKSSSPLRRPI